MPDTVSQPRQLLRRLRQVMATGNGGQGRLDLIVRLIAQNMVAEVCSIYVARAGGILELFATEGLKPEAVHNTRLRVGEGLVGLVAERALPLNLSEAPQHPRFVYRPETGEEIYHSFLGVPVLRSGEVFGVLVVQNVTARRYSSEEIEALQTIAMVIAEVIATGKVVDPGELSEDTRTAGNPVTLDGRALADGVGSGVAAFHQPRIKITRTIAEDIEQERLRLENAIAEMRLQLEDMIEHPDLAHGGEHREVLETYRMFAYDRGWQQKIREAVNSGLTAEAAADRVQQENRARLLKISDPYLRERVSDFEDLTTRLIRIIQGTTMDVRTKLTEPSVLVARSLGPAELMDYDRDLLKAVVLEEGSATEHVTIIARAMEIPVLGRVSGVAHHIQPGDHVIVDTENAHAYIRPADDVIETYRATIVARERLAAQYAAERDEPAITRDGTRIALFMNAGLLVDLPNVDRMGAEGIGLFRTEFQFMVSPALPKVEEQTKIYNAALDAAGDRPVVFRTLDIGGDKSVPFLPRDNEENPAMGWRAIRIALDRPALLRYQLRALLYAAAGRSLHVMFPMIAEVAELRRCKKILQKEVDRLARYGRTAPKEIKIGCMLEVPALSWQLPALFKEIDFLSVGTNDLMQFFFACDRSNPRLADRYDLLAPSVLAFLRSIILAGAKAGVPVTLCGEMGGRPLEAMALIALGLTRLSVSPAAIGPVKRMVRSVDLAQLQRFLNANITSADHSIRDSLLHFARDHHIQL
ncbi:phosphoenolpyruvate--protein phosphotransferase [Eilatimonas milleporae]|uniref:phosphoenolpyruvate--protein phosphotransferase n=1 Tax=Eilatimonas milleporae TaxID=911205 RepID=A0A3M0BZK6_9PROT|nr:phosphoenolpyruvate--protein phosphotransferase [Eilatimonas milleporae]RMB01530.1 phosphotransferase system enzyme I (PtsP) [Eilatimonas milleporae]